jgi:hypothetical protein
MRILRGEMQAVVLRSDLRDCCDFLIPVYLSHHDINLSSFALTNSSFTMK